MGARVPPVLQTRWAGRQRACLEQVVSGTLSVHLELPVHFASRLYSPTRVQLSLLPPALQGREPECQRVWFWFWFGLSFRVLAPQPLALAKVPALWMVLSRTQG